MIINKQNADLPPWPAIEFAVLPLFLLQECCCGCVRWLYISIPPRLFLRYLIHLNDSFRMDRIPGMTYDLLKYSSLCSISLQTMCLLVAFMVLLHTIEDNCS